MTDIYRCPICGIKLFTIEIRYTPKTMEPYLQTLCVNTHKQDTNGQ